MDDTRSIIRSNVSRLDLERAARLAVKGTEVKLDGWHDKLSEMREMSRSSSSAEEQAHMLKRCKLLLIEIEREWVELLQRVPETFRSHSRIDEMRRAMGAVRWEIQSLMATLDR